MTIQKVFRQPGQEQDKQLSSGDESKEEEHILVGRRGAVLDTVGVSCNNSDDPTSGEPDYWHNSPVTPKSRTPSWADRTITPKCW